MGVDARRSAVARDEGRVDRREACGVVHRASEEDDARRRRRRRARHEERAMNDRPNDTLARGADARDEGGDFLPRVE